MTKRRAIVCLAAGKSQILVIRKAQEMGFAIIAVDRNPEAPGFFLADERIIASTHDVKPILKHLEKFMNRYTLSAIVNRSSGPPVVTAAELSTNLGLPGISPDVARLVIDKGLLMDYCSRCGLPVPLSMTLVSSDCLNELEIPLPCVVKPALSLLGKSGVRVVSSVDELTEAVEEARAASFKGRVVLESFVPGHNVSLVSFVRSGILEPVVLVDELNGADEACRVYGAGMAVPSRFQGKKEEQLIINTAKEIISELKLDTTVCCMSFRCTNGGHPQLIEIHLDMGGDLILDQLLPASSFCDVLGYFIRGLTGERLFLSPSCFKPIAILFGKGDGLVLEKPYKILQSDTREDLEHLILLKEKNIRF